MVRTLVFQSNNLGSSPSNPILDKNKSSLHSMNHPTSLINSLHLLINTSNASTLQTSNSKFDIEYNFLFVSWVAPHLLFNRSHSSLQSRRVKVGVSIKKAYTMLTWLYYLTFTLDRQTENKVVKFSFLPRRRKMYTLTKAPMAHKTFSKEQFKFQLYKCKVSIRTRLGKNYRLQSIDHLKAAFIITKSSFPTLETNLLFLKTCRISMEGSAVNFYSYYLFSRK
jgi:hypothetical protein